MRNNKERAVELVARMTLNEKVGQLAQNFFGFNAYERDENNEIVLTDEFKSYVRKFGGIGMLNNYFRSDPWCKKNYETGGITLEEREKAYNILQKYIVENTRLGIPVLIEEDAPHGRQVLDSVLYPVSLNVGCSFNPELYSEQTYEIGLESKLGGVNLPYLSVFDMLTDPRWGRSEECFSEDPYLASQLSAAAVRGMNKSGNMVCCKHFAAQGAAVGGHNGGVSTIGERELREIHLPAARAAIKEGCDFIMAAYNEIDGVLCHQNSYLLNDILRGEFGFNGVVRSDGCAVDILKKVCGEDKVKAGALAVKSGVDCGLWDEAMTRLEEAVEKGYIDEKIIDKAVCRLIEKKYKCGLMDNPFLEEKNQSVQYIKSGSGQKMAYEMAAESLVLLKNKDALLPLSADKKILLVGGNFENIYYLLGDYTSERKNPNTVKDQFTRNGAEFIEGWSFEKGITADENALKAAASRADVIIFGCGGSSVRDFNSKYNSAGAIENAAIYMDCGEGRDLANLLLAECQKQALDILSDTGKPIVSLVIGGRPYVLTDIAEKSDALIWCGYPGQEGARAIYDTVFGKQNRFGRLSASFPRSVGQLPVNYNYKCINDYVDITAKPLFPFGFGLSYSEFEYSGLSVVTKTADEIKKGESCKVEFSVKNISKIAGSAVPQLYIKRSGGTITHREKELCSFKKIYLEPGETQRVTFEIGYDALAEWSVNRKYELFDIGVSVMLGKSSDEILIRNAFEIK